MARACVALTIADQLHICKVDVWSACPLLAASFSEVNLRLHSMNTDICSVAFENARLSGSGAIRKAHDVLTWLGKLDLLRAHGLSPSEVVGRWNKIATTYTQLTGQKRMCLLNLLDVDPKSIKLLLDHASKFSDRLCFQEDAFANKKVLPGFQYKPERCLHMGLGQTVPQPV
jgi:hypothetical protein